MNKSTRAVLFLLIIAGPLMASDSDHVPEAKKAFAETCQQWMSTSSMDAVKKTCLVLPARGDDPDLATELLSGTGWGMTDRLQRHLLEVALKYFGRWKNPKVNAERAPADRIGWLIMQLATNYNGSHDYSKTVSMMDTYFESRWTEMNPAMFQGLSRNKAEALQGLGRTKEAISVLHRALETYEGGWEPKIRGDLSRFGDRSNFVPQKKVILPLPETTPAPPQDIKPAILSYRVTRETPDALYFDIDYDNVKYVASDIYLIAGAHFQGQGVGLSWQITPVEFGRHTAHTALHAPETGPDSFSTDELSFGFQHGSSMIYEERKFPFKKTWKKAR